LGMRIAQLPPFLNNLRVTRLVIAASLCLYESIDTATVDN